MNAPSLRETVTPPGRLDTTRTPQRPWNPLELFVNPAVAARLWFIVAVGAVALCALQPYLLIRAYRTRERVVILDGSGSFHVSPLLGFEEASKLHEQHALLACLALLQRNPADSISPNCWKNCFCPRRSSRRGATGPGAARSFRGRTSIKRRRF
jgi:hypothetical protein